MSETATKPEPVIVKKYANRRLYNTETSSYITLEHLSTMTREGREFKVIDARTGDDITHSVLTQIVMEEETRGETLLPVSVLRQLIAMYGDQMQAMVPLYLEASMDAFRRNQEQFRQAFTDLMRAGQMNGNPFAELMRQNMSVMKAAAEMWQSANPLLAGTTPRPAPHAEDLQSLKKEIADLKTKLDRLVGN
ncbi:polyhydroxyalkanoate synthesis repressor PhaR [Thermaurantiacus sp.]